MIVYLNYPLGLFLHFSPVLRARRCYKWSLTGHPVSQTTLTRSLNSGYDPGARVQAKFRLIRYNNRDRRPSPSTHGPSKLCLFPFMNDLRLGSLYWSFPRLPRPLMRLIFCPYQDPLQLGFLYCMHRREITIRHSIFCNRWTPLSLVNLYIADAKTIRLRASTHAYLE